MSYKTLSNVGCDKTTYDTCGNTNTNVLCGGIYKPVLERTTYDIAQINESKKQLDIQNCSYYVNPIVQLVTNTQYCDGWKQT